MRVDPGWFGYYARISVVAERALDLDRTPSEATEAFCLLLEVLSDKGILNVRDLEEILRLSLKEEPQCD